MGLYVEKALKDKAALYIRVSTSFQADKDSLQVQRRELEAYSELVLGIKDYDVYEDPGYSGKDTSRPAYQRMMTLIRKGEYSHLIVWKIDRISRNLLDFSSMYSELRRLGVTFVSKNEQFDTSTAIGEAMLKIILVFAELERKMTAERVTAVMLSRASNGQWNGGRVPFGYDYDSETKTFSPNEQEYAVYRLICDLYEERHSLLKVCTALNSEGIRTRTGGLWNTVGVRKILTNIFYTGVYRYNVHSDGKATKKRNSSEWIDIENHHPALINEERFNRIGRLLKKNARGFHKPQDAYTAKHVHLFAGLLICGECGDNVTATPGRIRSDGFRPSSYGCASKRRKSNRCGNKYTSDTSLIPAVFPVIAGIIRSMGRRNEKVTPESLEKSIMSGMDGTGVSSIEGLDAFCSAIKSGKSGMEYTYTSTSAESGMRELPVLRAKKKKLESSLSRLQSLFLYGDNSISEKDYRIERKKILEELEETDSLLQEVGNAERELSNKEFCEQASYYIMVDKLISGKCNDMLKIIRTLDPSVPKAFLNRIIDNIVISGGRVSEIRFRSGLSLRYIYNEK